MSIGVCIRVIVNLRWVSQIVAVIAVFVDM